jgi:DNA-binding SARP family transcriptional activator
LPYYARYVRKIPGTGTVGALTLISFGEEERRPASRFQILGPLQVVDNERTVDLGSRKQQIVLALLLCNANSPVSVDVLSEALWRGEPPRTARKNIQVYVSTLRGLVGSGAEQRIDYRQEGYVFRVSPADLDSLSFAQHVRKCRGLGDHGAVAVARALEDAMRLWRGPALEGMRDVPLINAAALRLEQQFLTVFEDWAEAELAAGGETRVVERITELAAQHPLRERLRMLQMSALCQAGRRAEALAVYDETRRLLAHELGLSPSPALVGFYLAGQASQALKPEPGGTWV